MSTEQKTPPLDPVTFEVLKNAFATIVDQMGEQIMRTCHSFVIYNHDFSSGINDAQGNTVAQGTKDIASHVSTLHFQCKSVIETFGDDIHEGDVFLINDPYAGGTHFNDVSVVRPVVCEGGIIAFLQSKGHWTDVGGSLPGSFDLNAKEMFREGLRIPAVRLFDKGIFRKDVWNLVASNTRDPSSLNGDMLAQSEATHAGERELLRLVQKYGKDTVVQAMQEVQDYTERALRQRIAQLPDGVWFAEDFIDRDPATGEGLIPIKIKVTVDGSQVIYDFTGSHPPIGSLYNSAFGTTLGGVAAAMKMFIPDIPLNSGFYRPIDIITPENTIVDSHWPIAVSGFVMVFDKILNGLFEVWSELMPHRGIACAFNLEYMLMGGKDRRTPDDRYFLFYDWLPGGWGGRTDRDGVNVTAACFGTGWQTQPVEGQERLCPVVTTDYEIVKDSSGPGKYRGGAGVRKSSVLGPCKDTVISFYCDRDRSVVWGAQGGLPAMPHGMSLKGPDEDDEWVWKGACFSDVSIVEGEHFSRVCSGGGGYGDPLLRDPAAVLLDVEDDYVSVARARKDYGVVLRVIDEELAEYEVDTAATVAARADIAATRRTWLEEDSESVARRYREGKLDQFDLVRHYGVIVDWQTGELLPKTTKTYRSKMQTRSVKYWSN
jgi:N-methylhydantoinase B